MGFVNKKGKLLVAFSLLSALVPSVASAQQYNQTDLVSSIPALGTNALNGHDTQLVNSWGLTRSAGSAWWISDNGTGLATPRPRLFRRATLYFPLQRRQLSKTDGGEVAHFRRLALAHSSAFCCAPFPPNRQWDSDAIPAQVARV